MHLLFEDSILIPLEDAEIIYFPQFYNNIEANAYFKALLKNIAWQQDTITVFGKKNLQPRLTALYANNNNPYRYSNITMYPKKFNDVLLEIKEKVALASKTNFTSCLANLYRDGKDSNGWHADNEKELGKNPIIASVSLGSERIFHLKHKTKKELRYKIKLEHGSLLLMKGSTQENWLHQIPKTKKNIGERINLTFRVIA